MMSKKSIPQWTLTVTGTVNDFLTVSINGENLTKGSYVVDDGTVAHFEAKGSITKKITLDEATVASASVGEVAQYDLVIHANYTAKASYVPFTVADWKITTQT